MKRRNILWRSLMLFALLLSLAAGFGSKPTLAAGGLVAYIGSDSNVYLVEQDGSNIRTVFGDGGYYGISWSPDGVTLAGERATSSNQLALYNLVSGKVAHVSIDGNPQHLTWAAGGGGALAFDNNGSRADGSRSNQVSTTAIYVVNADGSGLHKVVDGYAPSWSPDVSHPTLFYLAAPYVAPNGRCNYSEGGGVPSLFYLSTGQSIPLFGKAVPFGVARPTWSPDGQTVGFGMHFWRRSDGKGVGTVPPGAIMSWSPDGRYVAWTDSVDGRDDSYYGVRLHIRTMSNRADRVIFTAKRKATLGGCTGITVYWSESGNRLAFADVDLNDNHAIWYSDNSASVQSHQIQPDQLEFGNTRKLYDLNPDGSAMLIANASDSAFYVYDINSGNGGKLGDGHAAQWQPRLYNKQLPPEPVRPLPPNPPNQPVTPPNPNPPEPSGDPNSVPLFLPPNSPFFQVWERADYPVYYGQVQRSWLWGPTVDASLNEPYAEGVGGKRGVIYYDKGRMEINNPNADPHSPWYVTSGLLVSEMVGGFIQVGNNATQPHAPNTRSVAGDGLDNVAPIYAAFAPLLAAAPDHTNVGVSATIDQHGHVGNNPNLAGRTWNAVYVAATGHNIPAVFWQFLNQRGLVYDGKNYHNDLLFDWVYTMGYPITDGYWTNISIGGQQHLALVQLYQRRTLTYVPDLAAGWQVQMGNVGLDYLDWRH